MSDAKSTKLNIREDRPTALASSAYGSNMDAVAFNVAFIAVRNPKLAVTIMQLYAEAHKIQATDPEAPDEDYNLFSDELRKIHTDEPEN
jgi:hypothetical protein